MRNFVLAGSAILLSLSLIPQVVGAEESDEYCFYDDQAYSPGAIIGVGEGEDQKEYRCLPAFQESWGETRLVWVDWGKVEDLTEGLGD